MNEKKISITFSQSFIREIRNHDATFFYWIWKSVGSLNAFYTYELCYRLIICLVIIIYFFRGNKFYYSKMV